MFSLGGTERPHNGALRAVLVAALMAASSLGLERAAHGAPSAETKAEAKRHFEQGKRFQDLGKLDDAIRAYQAAYDLVPLPQLLFNLGQAYRLKGDMRKALDAYEKFLVATPEGPGRDEARRNIKMVKLRIEVEEAEAARNRAVQEAEIARKRAEEEAAAARRQAEEATAARKQAEEAEAARRRATEDADAARRRTDAEDGARIKRLAEEMEIAARRRTEMEEAARRRRVEEAQGRGRAVRITGLALMGAGVITAGLSLISFFDMQADIDRIDRFNNDTRMSWSAELDRAVTGHQDAKETFLTVAGVGGSAFVAGFVVWRIGAAIRNGAIERAEKPEGQGAAMTLLPTLTAGGAVLDARWRF